jgi:AhpD family alkylhydroperoxidase
MRASQINGCAYCLDMHSKDARAAGETEQRLYLLDAWREAAHLYSERERAALAFTEAVTTLPSRQVPDDVYAAAKTQFNEAELANLALAITVINGWNRMNIAFAVRGGDYRPV